MALKDRLSIRTALFVKLSIEKYYVDGLLVPRVLTFSDHGWNINFQGDDYLALGNLLNVSSTLHELRPSRGTLTVSLSGIPNSSIEEIVKSVIKSSEIDISRGWFELSGELVDDPEIPNPIGRWRGYVNNYSITEEWDAENRESSNTIQLECKSWVDLLNKKTSGRQTNEQSMKRFFPEDPSFDRVWSLANSDFDFGKIKS